MPSRTQIDQLGDRVRSGKITDADLKMLDAYRRSFTPAYDKVIATIRECVGFATTGRPAKSTTSIVDKLQRESVRLTQMQDIAGCRLIIPMTRTQDKVARLITERLTAAVVDRRKSPSYGYRAVHVIARVDAKPIEIQVRTTLQHLWAEYSEKVADVIDPAVKYGGGPKEWQDLLLEASRLVERVEELELKRGTPSQRKAVSTLKQRLRRLFRSLTKDLQSSD